MHIARQLLGAHVGLEGFIYTIRNSDRSRGHRTDYIRPNRDLPFGLIGGPFNALDAIVRLPFPQSNPQNGENSSFKVIESVTDGFEFRVTKADERLAHRVLAQKYLDIKLERSTLRIFRWICVCANGRDEQAVYHDQLGHMNR